MKKILTILLVFFLISSLFGQWKYDNLAGVQPKVRVSIEELRTYGTGLPKILGQWYFVDPENGSNSASGKTIDKAVAELDYAYTLVTSGDGDGICVLSSGTTTGNTTSYLGTSIQWTKHGVTVFGVAAPTWYNMRARVADSAGVDTLQYLITVRGNNNVFYNLTFANSPDTTEVIHSAVKVTGVRNAFINCGFMCSPASANANKVDLWLSGADENLFSHCMIGNGSFDAGDNAACHIYIDGTTGNGQNLFENCKTIQQVSTGTAFGCVESGSATSLNGLIIFDNCSFYTWQANTGLTAMASWFIGTKPNTGQICLHQCGSFGFAEWDTVAGNDRVTSDMPTAAASAGGGLATHK